MSLLKKIGKLWHSKASTSLVIIGLRMCSMSLKFGLVVFIARYLGLADVGAYGLLAGAVSLVPVAVRMGMFNVLARDAVSAAPVHLVGRLTGYVNHLALAYGVLGLGSVAVGLILGAPWWLALMVCVVVVEHITADTEVLLNNLKQPRKAAAVSFMRNGLWIPAYCAVAWWLPEWREIPAMLVFWLMGSMLAWSLLWSTIKQWPWAAGWKAGWQLREHVARLKTAGYLYVGEVCNISSQYVDRYMISVLLGLEMTGVYVLFWQMANAVYQLANSGSMQVFRPYLIAAHDKGDATAFRDAYRRCIAWTMGESLVLVTVMMAALPVILPLTRQPLAGAYWPILALLLTGILVRLVSDLIAYRHYTRRRDKTMMKSYLLILLLVLLAAPLGMMLGGIYGVAMAPVVVYTLVSIYRIRTP